MFYIQHEITREYAHAISVGEHDNLTTPLMETAKAFDTRGEASDYSQNFGPRWNVVDASEVRS